MLARGRGILGLPGAPPAGWGGGVELPARGDPTAALARHSAAYGAGEKRRTRPRLLLGA